MLGDIGGGAVERDGRVGAEIGEGGEPFGLASGTDDLAGAEVLGDLDGHSPGVAGRPQDQDPLAGPEGNASAQGDPRRHGGVHGRRDEYRVALAGQYDAPAEIDDRLFGHRTHRGLRQDEVAQGAVGGAAYAVDAGDEGKLAGAGVVRAVGLGPHPRMQARGDDVDEDLLWCLWGRCGEVLAGRWRAEGSNDRCSHADSPGWLGTERA